MSDPHLVTRGEREPAGAGCSGASELGPVRTFCLAMGCFFLFLPPPPPASGFFRGGGQGLQHCFRCLLVGALKVSCAEHLGLMKFLGWAYLWHVAVQDSAGTPQ